MGKIFSGGFASGAAPVNYDGGTASGARTSIRLNGGTMDPAQPLPVPSVPEILSRIVYRNDCEYIQSASDPLQIDAITYNDNTLAKAVTEHMLANVAGSQPLLYASQNHTDGIYVRRHDHMLPGIDLSCISPWNSSDGVRRGVTAITRQHVAIANHYPIGVGAQVRFVSMQNETVTRTVATSIEIATDVRLLTLNDPLPDNIKPALVMPEDWLDYLGESILITTGMFITDRQERLIPARYGPQGGLIQGGITYRQIGFRASAFTPMASRFILPTSGDSGNPMFMVLDRQVVFLGSVHTPAGGSALYDKMQLLEAVTGNIPVNRVSLSGFTKYA